MKLPYTITICNLGLAFFITLLLSAGNLNGGILVFGAVCCVGGVADLIIGVILLLCKSLEWGKGFLLSAGMFLLIGLGICGPMLLS